MLYHLGRYLRKFSEQGPLIFQIDYANDDLGSIAVTLFVLISGAALMISCYERFDGAKFARRRFLAVLPIYWITYAAVTAYLWLRNGHMPVGGPPWSFLLTITGLDGFFYYRLQDYYLVGEWFIGFILLLYFFFPLLRTLILRWPWRSYASIVIFTAAFAPFYNHFFVLEDARNPLMRLTDFAGAMLFVRLGSKLNVRLFIPALLLAALMFTVPLPLPHVFKAFLTGAALFYVLAYAGQKLITNGFLQRCIETGARYSFPAYLVHHMLIFWLMPAHAAAFSASGLWIVYLLIVALSFGLGFLIAQFTDAIVRGVALLYKRVKLS